MRSVSTKDQKKIFASAYTYRIHFCTGSRYSVSRVLLVSVLEIQYTFVPALALNAVTGINKICFNYFCRISLHILFYHRWHESSSNHGCFSGIFSKHLNVLEAALL